MFIKKLTIMENESTIRDLKIMLILNKPCLFLPDDRFILFGSTEITQNFSAPKKSKVFLDGKLLGILGASGSLNIKSDHFNGILHAVYLT